VRFLVTLSPLTFLYPDLSMACIHTYGWLIFVSLCVLFLLLFFLIYIYIYIYLYFTYLFSRLIEDFQLAYEKDISSSSIIMIIHAINIK